MTAGSISAPSIIPLRSVQYGQTQKFTINTNTLIEISSETKDVDIYYTLDGSKPDPFTTLATRRSTIQYKKAFYIPKHIATSGKVTIKAIAVSKDGIRESVIVTKTFDVQIVESVHSPTDEHENRFVYELQQERKELIKKIQDENQQMQQKLSESMHRSTNEPFVQEKPPRYTHPDPQAQAGRLQKEIDFLRCAHCFAPRTGDLHARFCSECGLPWQNLTQTHLRLNQSDAHSLGTCANCKSTVPFNSDICVVCETPLSPEYQHRVNVQNQTKILCPQCKASNPINLRTCIICESKLMPNTSPQVQATVSVPLAPKPTGTMMTCSKCFRLNNADARFCDWCGAQPEKSSMPIQCTKCRSENDPYAKFCLTCGCIIEPPLRVIDARLRNDLNISASSVVAGTLTRPTTGTKWLNANATFSNYRQPYLITKSEIATQTHGIYYPSAKEIDILVAQNKQLQADREFKERRPILTAVSPGKGYWRQQMDHICAHLKAYAVNRPDFRSLIGEPRMSKMIHATVHENEYQVTIQAVFRKPENLSQSAFYIDETHGQYAMNSERSSTFSSTFNSDDEYTREKTQLKKTRKRPRKRPQSASATGHDSQPNRALLKLLERKIGDDTKKSSIHIDILQEVKQLIKEGADGNLRNKEGFTVLQLAVRNRHNECLETLIKDGKAKLDLRGPKGNTALHECCFFGYDGIEPLKILLKNGGELTWMNDRKESVIDVATKQNCPELMQIIASHCGQQMIDRQMKIYNNHHNHPYDSHARTTTVDGHRSS
ncbi:unnamed protein product [Rotaria sordida]|uniref:Double zinc ribbon and ankyrin repeat-containing protein 1 n=1 Tax=Rotaria sordida TaxID=392033 RepID=A0A813SXQ4_9BILA|nr:unnamed protein product [Rotaria sordida]CAF0912780.1 unnamed protein product [Rotaria sordida]